VLLQICFTSRTFAIETGCPPPELLVTVSITSGIFFAPSRSITSASRACPYFLKRMTNAALSLREWEDPSPGHRRIRNWRGWCQSACCSTMSPFLHITLKRMRSAARPWCVGITWRKPKIAGWNRGSSEARRPGVGSSPRIIAAHCSVDMADVPKSVSKSMRMAFRGKLKRGCSRRPRSTAGVLRAWWCGSVQPLLNSKGFNNRTFGHAKGRGLADTTTSRRKPFGRRFRG